MDKVMIAFLHDTQCSSHPSEANQTYMYGSWYWLKVFCTVIDFAQRLPYSKKMWFVRV